MSQPFTVFYSWQSDLPNATNRSFIEEALRKAVQSLGDLEIAIDRDTKDLPGSPDISAAIFAKIEKADAFVCDASIINMAAITSATIASAQLAPPLMRAVPNPNVLVELGYAMHVLPWERILLVVNSAHGGVDYLPFDIRRRRVLTYSLLVGEEKADVKKQFVKTLALAINSIYQLGARAEIRPLVPSLADQVIQQIGNNPGSNQADTSREIRRLWRQWMEKLEALSPPFAFNSSENNATNAANFEVQLREALEKSIELTCEFGRVAASIAEGGSLMAAKTLYDGFLPLLQRYNIMWGANGQPRFDSLLECDADFYRFIGHEWFVMLVAAFLRAENYQNLGTILARSFTFAPAGQILEEAHPFQIVNSPPWLLFSRGQIRDQGASLKARHESPELQDVISWREFWEADYFLFLRTQLTDVHWDQHPPGVPSWIMWTASQIHRGPAWTTGWRSRRVVDEWLPALSLPSYEELKLRLEQRQERLDPSRSFGHSSGTLFTALVGIE